MDLTFRSWNIAVFYCRLDGLHGQKSAIKDFESVFDRLNDGHLEEWLLQLSVIVLPVCCTVFRPPELNKEDTGNVHPLYYPSGVFLCLFQMRYRRFLIRFARFWSRI